MRLAGRVVEWNDEKGYGFVVPNGGGDRAFVHVKEFQRGSRRPVANDLITYLPIADQRGRLNAQQIRHAGEKVEAPRSPSRVPRAALGASTLAGIVVGSAMGVVPAALAVVYLAMSGASYLAYWADKSAANRGKQRTPEKRLHLMDLLGGWPGALIAQQRFHHKTAKQSFQRTFRTTLVLNLALAAAIIWHREAVQLLASLGG